MTSSVGPQVSVLNERVIDTTHGPLRTRLYRGSDGMVGMALWMGDLAADKPLLARVHSSCFTSEGLAALDCDCSQQLDSAFFAVAAEGRGIVFYLLQEGRGAGLPNKARDRSIVQTSRGVIDTYGAYRSLGLDPDPRKYDLIKPICADLGIRQPLMIMTNNPLKLDALTSAGLSVVAKEHALPASTFNSQYLAAKARSGHALALPTVRTVTVPPGLDTGDPNVGTLAGFARVASYGLPVHVGSGPVWLRATSYVHEESGHDRFVLSYWRAPDATELRYVYRENLEERLGGGGSASRGYRAALERIVARGCGSVLAIAADPGLLTGRAGPSEAQDLALLNAHGRALGAETYEEVA